MSEQPHVRRQNWRKFKHDVTRPDKGLSEVGLMSTERIQHPVEVDDCWVHKTVHSDLGR